MMKIIILIRGTRTTERKGKDDESLKDIIAIMIIMRKKMCVRSCLAYESVMSENDSRDRHSDLKCSSSCCFERYDSHWKLKAKKRGEKNRRSLESIGP